jgi:ATP-binding cassette subfamily B protein/subfamily B ATP-binding cassette protein MsbA
MLRRLVPYWRPAWVETVSGAVLLTLVAGVEVLQPWPLKWLVDYVFGSRQSPHALAAIWPAFARREFSGMLFAVCAVTLLLALSQRILQLISHSLLVRAGARVVKQLRSSASDHVHRLGFDYHDRTKVGDSIYRLAYDTAAAMSLISQGVAPVLTGILLLLGIFTVMMSLDRTLTLIAAGIVPCFWLIIHGFGRSIGKRTKTYHAHESSLVSVLQESLSSIRAVQAFAREPQAAEHVDEHAGRSLGAIQRLVFVQLAFSACVGIAMAAGTTAIIWVGAHRVIAGHISLGDILIFLAYLGMLYQPMNAFSQSASVAQSSRAQLQRVFDILDTDSEIVERPNAIRLPRVTGKIDFRDVNFAYDTQPILRNIDIFAEPGQIIAIVGRTGAGKTTIASLLLRFYDPTSGAVFLDGHDLRDLKLRWLRKQISVVLQDAIIFSGTVRENIAYGRLGATAEEIEVAARRAQAHEFIHVLSGGYNALLGERGVNLSGGQRQRIAIARAFLKDAPVLILDEPTSALDTHTEQALLECIRELMIGRTTFIIAHRLSTVRYADTILVLRDGVIVERGSHYDLIGGDTLYRWMYESQWKDDSTRLQRS